jgi:hypothetical protein
MDSEAIFKVEQTLVKAMIQLQDSLTTYESVKDKVREYFRSMMNQDER